MTNITCEHCCGADKIFDEKSARKQLKRYLKRGPRKTTRKLIESILSTMNGASSLLEVGGGIGCVQVELLRNGIERVTNVDASSGYHIVAKELAEKEGFIGKISYHEGDFMDHVKSLEKHDVVVMDKVICCYPHMDDLLYEAIGRTNDVLALEKTAEYKGQYHVLGGALSPLEGISPDDLKIRELMSRLDGSIIEVIVATNPNTEGEATALYLEKLIKPLGISVTRIARGLPVGGDLEYADEITLTRALQGRMSI